MSGLTPISWKKFEKFLLHIGCEFKREKGDHRIYSKFGLKRPVVIPRDTQLPIFIIRNNLRILGFDVEDYLRVLEDL
ncbi:MAG: type II toxin-antitoxin system HicA family toxin [Patescibacteria group bacterium]|nr:type II toxin-antitoxin system HicA family toxin [Patescibacteria group bacterium]